MTDPKPKLRWFQFSLAALLLLTLFVAVLCSIAVCTHWFFSGLLAATVLIGGIAGRIVAGTSKGFLYGIVFGIELLFWVGYVGSFLLALLLPENVFSLLLRSDALRPLFVVLAIVVLIGGIAGGLLVRFRSR